MCADGELPDSTFVAVLASVLTVNSAIRARDIVYMLQAANYKPENAPSAKTARDARLFVVAEVAATTAVHRLSQSGFSELPATTVST